MKKKLLILFAVLLILGGLSGSGYLWHLKTGLEEQIVGLNADLDASKRKTRAAMKKYFQEKAKVATCMRGKMALEAQKGKLFRELKAAVAIKSELEARIQAVKEQFKEKVAQFNEKVLEMKAYRDKMNQRRQELIEKYKALAAKSREQQGRIETLEMEKAEVESTLNQTQSRLNRSLKHNEKLCVVAEDLTEKYRERTHGSSEPFTKIQMVELEHMIQEYLKRIDKEKIIEQ